MFKQTRKDQDIDAVIDLRVVFQQPFDEIAYTAETAQKQTWASGSRKVIYIDHKDENDTFDMR